MRVDLPYCGFKNCRYSFDGNCTKPSEQGKCDYWYLLHEELPSAEPETPSNGSITCVKSEKMNVRPTDDLISRQDAIRLAEQGQIQGFEWQFKKLCMLPSAEKTQLSGEDATSVFKCPCVYREPCDYCHYDGHLGLGCPYLQAWDMSVDDWTYICKKLNVQIDGCDTSVKWLLPTCPIERGEQE